MLWVLEMLRNLFSNNCEPFYMEHKHVRQIAYLLVVMRLSLLTALLAFVLIVPIELLRLKMPCQ